MSQAQSILQTKKVSEREASPCGLCSKLPNYSWFPFEVLMGYASGSELGKECHSGARSFVSSA